MLYCTGDEIANICWQTQGQHMRWQTISLRCLCIDLELTPSEILTSRETQELLLWCDLRWCKRFFNIPVVIALLMSHVSCSTYWIVSLIRSLLVGQQLFIALQSLLYCIPIVVDCWWLRFAAADVCISTRYAVYFFLHLSHDAPIERQVACVLKFPHRPQISSAFTGFWFPR